MYRTRDLPLAAYLMLRGQSHVALERQSGKGWWVFIDADPLRTAVAEYQSGEVTINLMQFMDCVSKVRSELYAFLDT